MSTLTDRIATVAGRLLRTRRFVRAPIGLYRAGLGFLFGHRLLMLVHVGRKTGARRYVVLEVVARPSPDSYVVAAGFGERAQWYRNVLADPRIGVYVGGRLPRVAHARVLDEAEGAAALSAYAERHPRSWRALRPVFESTLNAPIDERGTSLPLVALEIRDR